MKSAAVHTSDILILLSLVLFSFVMPAPADTLSFSCGDVTEIPQLECEALVALYSSTDGDNWENNTNWLVTNTPSNWHGVTVTSGQVTRIYLHSNGLSGTIPPELGNLAALDYLRLYGNPLLAGSVPPQLGNLTALRTLVLAHNQLSGSIPPELSSLVALQDLWLGYNQLSGSIPPELGNLNALEWLSLGGNQLSGSIPPELGNLATLKGFEIWDTQLGGSIPPELGNLSALEYLYLRDSELSGSIPPELGNLTALLSLDLQGNQLSGSIPPELGNLAALEWLDLGANRLTGSIPPELGNLASLQALWLWYNELTGSVPPQIGNLAALETLYVNVNLLTGSIPLSFINLSQLEDFVFEDTYLCEPTTPEYLAWKATVGWYSGTGISCRALSCTSVTEIPEAECEALVALYDSTVGDYWTDNTNWLVTDTPSDWYGVTVSNGHVTQLDLSSNALKLRLPPNLGDLSALQVLALQANPLQGHVPLSLVNLSQLDTFYFFETDLCELPRPEYLAWKETVGDYQGTGVCQTWTLMYYQALDSKSEKGKDMGPYGLEETEQLKAGSNNPYVSIAIFRDTLADSAVYEAYIDGQLVETIPKGELNTGEPATLSEFVLWAKSSFPADRCALTIFGHGHGQAGTSQDLTTGTGGEDFLSPKEFRTALELSGPFDVIYMEACLVANLEHAYQARGQASYYVASEALMYGWQTHPYVNRISSTTAARDLARDMAAAYLQDVRANAGDHSRTISVGDLSQIEEVKKTTNAFATEIRAHRVDLGIAIWQIISGNIVQRFDDRGDGISENDLHADLYHFAQMVGWLGEPDLTLAADNLTAAIDAYVIDNRLYVGPIWDHSHAHGLSILLTKKLACYYTSDWFDFSGDVSWFCNPGARAIDQQPGEWGQMLSDYIWEFEPDPEMLFEPPPLLPPHVPPQDTLLFLPLILRMSPQ